MSAKKSARASGDSPSRKAAAEGKAATATATADKATSDKALAAAEKTAEKAQPVFIVPAPAVVGLIKTKQPPTIEVPEGREPPETLSETMAKREAVSEEARENPTVHGTSGPVDTSTPTTSTTTTTPQMGVDDDTVFTKAKAPKDKPAGGRRQ